jgi:V8-like Glu-specific endopeptidase
MRITAPETDSHKQQRRRRRSVAAPLCLGSLAAVALGTFEAEQQEVRSRAQGQSRAAVPGPVDGAGAVPSPQPLTSQLAAYPFGLAPAGSIGGAQRAAQLPSGQGPAGPGSVSPAPNIVGPTAPNASGNTAATNSTADTGNGPPNGSFSAMTAPSAPPSSSMTVSNPRAATAFAGLPQVGAIFDSSNSAAMDADGTPGSHYCSGSVVDSQTGDIVITAAHCVYDTSAGAYVNSLAFVPGYHDGQEPYGIWTPSKIVVPQQWIDSGDPDYDVAFIVVHQPGSSDRIQDQVGADELGLNPSYTGLVQVVGYPGTTEQPVTCTDNMKELGPTQLEFDCPGFPDGTSGGPFLADVDRQTGQGTVVGVIGGYETGGDTPDTSYSAYFGSAVADLFTQAEAAG